MKIYTSYFYQIRFFKPNMIPFSTAVWDPKWFHAGNNSGYKFIDKNGVINGLRVPELSPQVGGCCKGCKKDPETCDFISAYRGQLNELDFDHLMNYLESRASYFKSELGFTEEPEIILMVYETPDNKCSERNEIQKLFKNHGIEVREWSKDES